MTDVVAWTAADTAARLRAPTAESDKYSRGVLGVRTGSAAYPGAAVLGVQAAWRTGVGMVRYLGPDRAAGLVLARRPETVTRPGRVQAWLVGSGTDAASRTDADTAALQEVLAGTLPVVVDAGALPLVSEGAAPRVITPHAAEHAAVRERLGLPPAAAGPAARAAAARETAAALRAAVLLKGSVTVAAAPSGWAAAVDAATPWLATAGTGDVLAGVLGALVAGAQAAAEHDGRTMDAEELARVAAAAAWLHGRAGVIASDRHGGGPITALDVAAALPRAVAAVLSPAS